MNAYAFCEKIYFSTLNKPEGVISSRHQRSVYIELDITDSGSWQSLLRPGLEKTANV